METEKNYYPLHCPKFEYVCSGGLSKCLPLAGTNYRNCKLRKMDVKRTKIKLNELNGILN